MAFEFQSQIPCCHEVQLDLFQEKEKIKMSVLSSVRLSVNRNWRNKNGPCLDFSDSFERNLLCMANLGKFKINLR